MNPFDEEIFDSVRFFFSASVSIVSMCKRRQRGRGMMILTLFIFFLLFVNPLTSLCVWISPWGSYPEIFIHTSYFFVPLFFLSFHFLRRQPFDIVHKNRKNMTAVCTRTRCSYISQHMWFISLHLFFFM